MQTQSFLQSLSLTSVCSYVVLVPAGYIYILLFLKKQNQKIAGNILQLSDITIRSKYIAMTSSTENTRKRRKKNIVSIGNFAINWSVFKILFMTFQFSTWSPGAWTAWETSSVWCWGDTTTSWGWWWPWACPQASPPSCTSSGAGTWSPGQPGSAPLTRRTSSHWQGSSGEGQKRGKTEF